MVNEYIEYFRTLAEQHPAIRHERINETQNGKPQLCRFGRFWNIDLYLEKPPEGLSNPAPCLHLQLFDGNIHSRTGHYDVRGEFEGGILITASALKNNRQDEERCLKECYDIALDFLKQFYDDSGCFCEHFVLKYDQVKLSQVGPIWDNRYGWWLTFGMEQQLNLHERINVFEPQNPTP